VEVIRGSLHVVFPMEDASRVGEARRHALEVAHACGFDEVAAGRVALIVTELGTNLIRHARGGRLMISNRGPNREVEVISLDDGPGIADIDRSLADGFSTGSTPGTGLGAVRRLASTFDMHSVMPTGTVVVARVRGAASFPTPPPAKDGICVGAVSVPAPGEEVCGDGWGFAVRGELAALMVVDGLGHGPDAAEAAAEALDVFQEEPLQSPRRLLERVHVRLRSTRGAAVAMMLVDAGAGTVRSAGAGNVLGRLVSGISDRTLMSQHGTAGVSIRTPEEVSTPWPPHALLVLCSDGIGTRWDTDALLPVLGRDPALAAAIVLRDHVRGRDDATVAVLRRKD
jgi:anti-sigma regulatory factor (Ser/Thr protein kinase)